MKFKIGNLNGRKVVTFKDVNGERKRHRLSARTNEEAAIEGYQIYKEYWEKIDKGREWKIKEIWVAYRNSLGNRSTGRRMKSEEGTILPHFGGFRPQDITDELVQDYIAKRANRRTGAPISDGTLWTELGHLRDAISFALKKHWLRPEDARYIPRPSKPAPRDVWITKPQARTLLQASEDLPHLFAAIHLMLATAGRVGAILELTWDRVHFDGETVDLRVNSTLRMKKRAHVPMTKTLKKILSEMKPLSQSDHVVEWNGQPIKSLKGAFKARAESVGLGHVTPHDLRHTAAVWMAAAGCEMERISQYLGHDDVRTTRKIYARFAPDHLRKEAEAVEVYDLR